MTELRIIALPGLPEIVEGDDLPSLLAEAARRADLEIAERDIFVIAQKIVSKAEGRTIALEGINPSPLARRWAAEYGKDARLVEVVLKESHRIVRMERGIIISETRHGFVCANAGVDASNAAEGTAVLLPKDPEMSARLIREALEAAFGLKLAVIISDTFGRPWREGLVNIALAVSGIAPLLDYRGRFDSHGNLLKVTVLAVADELASAAELVMGKTIGVPVAIVRGFDYEAREPNAREMIRPPHQDLFR